MCCPSIRQVYCRMIAAFGSIAIVTKALNIIWFETPLLRIHELELTELMDNVGTRNNPWIRSVTT